MTFADIAVALVGIAVALAVNEMSEVSPWLARRIAAAAASLRYGQTTRAEVRKEEHQALINDRPGKLLKLLTALGLFTAAVAHRWLGRRVAAPTTAKRRRRSSRSIAAVLRMSFGALFMVTIVFGYFGFLQYLADGSEYSADSIDIAYYTLQLFTLGSDPLRSTLDLPAFLQIARLTAPLITAYAVIEAFRLLLTIQTRRTQPASVVHLGARVAGPTAAASASVNSAVLNGSPAPAEPDLEDSMRTNALRESLKTHIDSLAEPHLTALATLLCVTPAAPVDDLPAQ